MWYVLYRFMSLVAHRFGRVEFRIFVLIFQLRLREKKTITNIDSLRLQSVCMSIGSGHPGHAYHSKHSVALISVSDLTTKYLLHIVSMIIVAFHYCQLLKSSIFLFHETLFSMRSFFFQPSNF